MDALMLPGMNMMKRAALWLLVGTAVYGLGGCSLKSIGAGLLSEFLTSGGASSLNSTLTSDLGTALTDLLGTGT